MPYTVETYDVADDPARDGDWTHVATVERPMQLRPVLRSLLSQGYDTESIAVDRVDDPRRKSKGVR